MQYFKKRSPSTKLNLSNGKRLQFESIDYVTGVFKTEDDSTVKGIEAHIANHTGGVEKIEQAEYEELLKKKLSGESVPKPQWHRDLFTSGGLITQPTTNQSMTHLRPLPAVSLVGVVAERDFSNPPSQELSIPATINPLPSPKVGKPKTK